MGTVVVAAISFIVGGSVGIVVCGLMVAASRSDDPAPNPHMDIPASFDTGWALRDEDRRIVPSADL
jgi:hypothetical protein